MRGESTTNTFRRQSRSMASTFFQEPVFLWGRTRKSGNDDIVALGMEYNRFSTLGLEFGVS